MEGKDVPVLFTPTYVTEIKVESHIGHRCW